MHTLRNKLLFYGAAAAAGCSSLALHRYMMNNCFDDKGLLIAGNLPELLMLAVGAAFVLGMGLLVRRLGGDGTYEDNFPRDMVSGVLLVAAGLVLAMGTDAQTQPLDQTGGLHLLGSVLEIGGRVLPWLAAGSMAVLGVCRIQGRRPRPVFSGLVCLHFMIMLVRDYRLWSADPQVHNYAYQLLAGVLLMLCAFHRTCCDAGIIQRRKLLATGLGAAFCCMAALAGDFQLGFFLASGLWAAGSMCHVAVLPPDPEEEEQPEEETE
jgi:hypothetical protein